MDFFISNAYAQAAPAGDQGAFTSMIMLVGIFVVFYFFLIRPQNKRQKEHREMVANLSKGDEVTTAGGLLGKITEVGDSFVKIEIADNVIVAVQKHTVQCGNAEGHGALRLNPDTEVSKQ